MSVHQGFIPFCLLFLSTFFSISHGTSMELPVIRGVSPAEAPLYAGSEFRCRDGSKWIPFNQVNDDYCDCNDGSDEPGTSACSPHGQFYCTNVGHKGHFIQSSRVDDGYCDCCDGSDEPTGVCENTCQDKGTKARRAIQAEIDIHREGAAIKERYSREAAAAFDELAEELEQLRKQNIHWSDFAATIRGNLEKLKIEEEERIAKEKEEQGIENVQTSEPLVPETTTPVEEIPEEEETEAEEGDEAFEEEFEEEEEEEEDVHRYQSPEEQKYTSDLREAETELGNTQKRINEIEKMLDIDFGRFLEFFYMYKQCYELKTMEYVYKVCPFDIAKQDTISLGAWAGMDEHGFKFENGAQCWGGPKRSLRVNLVCGTTTEVKAIDEPSRCSYSAIMSTPAVCSKGHADLLALSLLPAEADTIPTV